jgi:hypothetical protein
MHEACLFNNKYVRIVQQQENENTNLTPEILA